MRRDVRAAQLVEHVRGLRTPPAINGILNAQGYAPGMGIETLKDPASAINAKAKAEGWPFRCDPELEFNRDDLNLLRDTWLSEATPSPMSERTLFDIQALKGLHRRITLIERISQDSGPARYRVKYQGSYLAALMGSNIDKYVDEHIPPYLLPRWHTVFDTVMDSGAPIRLVIDFEFARLNFASAEGFIAPLSNGAGKVNLMLIAMYIKPRETDTQDDETNDA